MSGARQKVEGALYPDEITVATEAFKAAVAALDESIYAEPHYVRQCLAEYICAHALVGELDVDSLRDGALRYVRKRFMGHAVGSIKVIVTRETGFRRLA